MGTKFVFKTKMKGNGEEWVDPGAIDGCRSGGGARSRT